MIVDWNEIFQQQAISEATLATFPLYGLYNVSCIRADRLLGKQ